MRSPRSIEVASRPPAPRLRARALAAVAVIAPLVVASGAHTTYAQPKPAPSAPVPAGPKPATTTTPNAAPSAPVPAGPKPASSAAPTSKLAGPKLGQAGKPAPSATASTPPPPAEGDEVGRLYAEGFAAFERTDYAAAEIAFTKAWGLSRSFDVAGALGSTKLELGKYREAAQYLSFALRNALPSTRATVRDRIKRDLDSAKQKLATVKLTVSLLEARVAVDGAMVDPIFLGSEIYVDPGKRTFEATADGHTPATSTVDTKAGEVAVVNLKLERTAAPKGGAPPDPDAATQSTPWPAAVLGGAGGVAIIAGAVLIGAAESSKQNAYDLARNTLTPEGTPTCPKTGPGPTERCDQVRSAAANADTFGNVGIGVFAGAGVLLAGATVYMLFIRTDPPPPPGEKPPAPTSRIVPVVGTSGGGLVWSGSF